MATKTKKSYAFIVYRPDWNFTNYKINLLLAFMITKDKNLKNELSNRCDSRDDRHYDTIFSNQYYISIY